VLSIFQAYHIKTALSPSYQHMSYVTDDTMDKWPCPGSGEYCILFQAGGCQRRPNVGC